MTRFMLVLALPALLSLAGCGGGSQGESLGKQLCDCMESAKTDMAKTMACATKQAELQRGIEDPAEAAKFVNVVSKCAAH